MVARTAQYGKASIHGSVAGEVEDSAEVLDGQSDVNHLRTVGIRTRWGSNMFAHEAALVLGERGGSGNCTAQTNLKPSILPAGAAVLARRQETAAKVLARCKEAEASPCALKTMHLDVHDQKGGDGECVHSGGGHKHDDMVEQ
jgi:hypothetical protein